MKKNHLYGPTAESPVCCCRSPTAEGQLCNEHLCLHPDYQITIVVPCMWYQQNPTAEGPLQRLLQCVQDSPTAESTVFCRVGKSLTLMLQELTKQPCIGMRCGPTAEDLTDCGSGTSRGTCMYTTTA